MNLKTRKHQLLVGRLCLMATVLQFIWMMNPNWHVSPTGFTGFIPWVVLIVLVSVTLWLLSANPFNVEVGTVVARRYLPVDQGSVLSLAVRWLPMIIGDTPADKWLLLIRDESNGHEGWVEVSPSKYACLDRGDYYGG